MPRLPALQRHPLSIVAAVALAATLAMAGCGSSNKSSSSSSSKKSAAPASKPASGGNAVSETETDFKFSDPKPIATAKSGTVTFNVKNSGGTTHALEVEGPKGEVKSGTIQPGQSTSLKAKLSPGKYEFYCPVDGHKKLGMKGEVTVK
jgi:uncharacterized cupredoxin-like copper-binding protein